MKKCFFVFLGILALGTGLQTFADDNEYTYRVSNYPNSQNSCDETAASLGKQISSALSIGITDIRTDETEDNLSCNINFIYSAPAPVHIESNVRTVISAIDVMGQGTYRSRKECLDALADQRDLFEKSSGMKSLLSYCYEETDVLSFGKTNRPFVLRIDGFGESLKHPLTATLDLIVGEANETRVEAEIFKSLQARGIDVAQVAFRRDVLGYAPVLLIRYLCTGQNCPSRLWRLSLDRMIHAKA